MALQREIAVHKRERSGGTWYRERKTSSPIMPYVYVLGVRLHLAVGLPGKDPALD